MILKGPLQIKPFPGLEATETDHGSVASRFQKCTACPASYKGPYSLKSVAKS